MLTNQLKLDAAFAPATLVQVVAELLLLKLVILNLVINKLTPDALSAPASIVLVVVESQFNSRLTLTMHRILCLGELLN